MLADVADRLDDVKQTEIVDGGVIQWTRFAGSIRP